MKNLSTTVKAKELLTYEVHGSVPEEHVQLGHDAVRVCLPPPLDWEVVYVSNNLNNKTPILSL